MRPPDEATAAVEAEIEAAERSLARYDLSGARVHLAEAAKLGAHKHDVDRLHRAIETIDKDTKRRVGKGYRAGLAICALGYLVLCFRHPYGWGPPLWAVLALLLVPGLAGFATGRIQGPGRTPGQRFRSALKAAAVPMFLYASISMIVARAHIGSSGGAGAVLLVGLFVAVADAIAAGVVAGMVSARLACVGAAKGGPA